MTYDEELAARVRRLLPKADEKRMFGGIGLMEHGHMVAAVTRGDLLLRVPAEETERWLGAPGAGPAMPGRTMRGWVKVRGSALAADRTLAAWVRRSQATTRQLPPK
jgi:TfoX/Sxy family transcriptional regulator of competence genes